MAFIRAIGRLYRVGIRLIRAVDRHGLSSFWVKKVNLKIVKHSGSEEEKKRKDEQRMKVRLW